MKAWSAASSIDVPQELAGHAGLWASPSLGNCVLIRPQAVCMHTKGHIPEAAGWGLEQSNGPWIPFKVCTEEGEIVQMGVRGAVP